MLAILSVSGRTSDCAQVVATMARLGICGDVTSNASVGPQGPEPGCRITVSGAPVRRQTERLWEALSAAQGLGCAHVWIVGAESGCVKDIFRPSACPLRGTEGPLTDQAPESR